MSRRLAILGLAALAASACGSSTAGGSISAGPAPGFAAASDAGIDPSDRSDAGVLVPLAPEEPEPTACGCSTSADDPIELHVVARDLSRQRMDALAALLEKDGFEVLFVEYADETGDPKIAIETTPSRFVAVFKGRIEAQTEARSAGPGFSCQLAVEGAIVPRRYRKLVRAVQTPDPQLY